jgi:hypothetical protein
VVIDEAAWIPDVDSLWMAFVPTISTRREYRLSLVDNGGQDKRVKGLEPSTFTSATCGRCVLNRDAPKSYGTGGVTIHSCLPEGNEVVVHGTDCRRLG